MWASRAVFICLHSVYENEILKEPQLNAFLNGHSEKEEGKKNPKLVKVESWYCIFIFSLLHLRKLALKPDKLLTKLLAFQDLN